MILSIDLPIFSVCLSGVSAKIVSLNKVASFRRKNAIKNIENMVIRMLEEVLSAEPKYSPIFLVETMSKILLIILSQSCVLGHKFKSISFRIRFEACAWTFANRILKLILEKNATCSEINGIKRSVIESDSRAIRKRQKKDARVREILIPKNFFNVRKLTIGLPMKAKIIPKDTYRIISDKYTKQK